MSLVKLWGKVCLEKCREHAFYLDSFFWIRVNKDEVGWGNYQMHVIFHVKEGIYKISPNEV